MWIRYLGPSESVNVVPFGPHVKNGVKAYPDDFAEDLLETSEKQRFEVAEEAEVLKDMTVEKLKKELDAIKVKYPGNAKKDELIVLLLANTAEPPEEE